MAHFPLKIGTTILRVHSTAIQNPSSILKYFSHHLNSYSPNSSNQLMLQVVLLKVQGLFLFSLHLMPEARPLYLLRLTGLLLHLLPLYDHNHDHFHLILPDITSFHLAETQLSITSSHTPSTFNFFTISFQSSYHPKHSIWSIL